MYIYQSYSFPTVRLYDVSTLQCFVSSDARDQHLDAVTAVHYSSDGRLYASSSLDGSIKVSFSTYRA